MPRSWCFRPGLPPHGQTLMLLLGLLFPAARPLALGPFPFPPFYPPLGFRRGDARQHKSDTLRMPTPLLSESTITSLKFLAGGCRSCLGHGHACRSQPTRPVYKTGRDGRWWPSFLFPHPTHNFSFQSPSSSFVIHSSEVRPPGYHHHLGTPD